jgi:hypothetical protein
MELSGGAGFGLHEPAEAACSTAAARHPAGRAYPSWRPDYAPAERAREHDRRRLVAQLQRAGPIRSLLDDADLHAIFVHDQLDAVERRAPARLVGELEAEPFGRRAIADDLGAVRRRRLGADHERPRVRPVPRAEVLGVVRALRDEADRDSAGVDVDGRAPQVEAVRLVRVEGDPSLDPAQRRLADPDAHGAEVAREAGEPLQRARVLGAAACQPQEDVGPRGQSSSIETPPERVTTPAQVAVRARTEHEPVAQPQVALLARRDRDPAAVRPVAEPDQLADVRRVAAEAEPASCIHVALDPRRRRRDGLRAEPLGLQRAADQRDRRMSASGPRRRAHPLFGARRPDRDVRCRS